MVTAALSSLRMHSFETSRGNSPSRDGNMQGSGGRENQCAKGAFVSRFISHPASFSFSFEPAGLGAAAHSWRYLRLLSESARSLPASQLHTRLRLTPRAASGPGAGPVRGRGGGEQRARARAQPARAGPAPTPPAAPPAACELGRAARDRVIAALSKLPFAPSGRHVRAPTLGLR